MTHEARGNRRKFASEYRPARTRATVTIVLLGIIGLVSLLTAFHHVAGFDLIRQAESGTLSSAEALDFDATTQALAGGFLIAFVAAAIAFLAWLSRTVDNVPALTGEVPDVTPRWSIGWWFVPIANLWKPYQVVKGLLKLLGPGDRQRGTGLVLAWWLVWLAAGIGGTVVARLPEPSTLDQLSGWFTANLVADGFGVASAVFAILVVRRIQSLAEQCATVQARSSSLVTGTSTAQHNLALCPRCGSPRVPGARDCATCGLDLWSAYDQARGSQGSD